MKQEAKKRRVAVARSLGRWANQKLSAAFARWYEMQQEAKKQQVAVQRTLGRWVNQKLSAAFTRWYEMQQEMKEQRVAIRRAAGRWLNQKLSSAVMTWREVLQEQRRLRVALQRTSAVFLTSQRMLMARANGLVPNSKVLKGMPCQKLSDATLGSVVPAASAVGMHCKEDPRSGRLASG